MEVFGFYEIKDFSIFRNFKTNLFQVRFLKKVFFKINSNMIRRRQTFFQVNRLESRSDQLQSKFQTRVI